MADQQSHIRQWKHNRRFVGTISTEFPDWIVTGVFYVALHAVDALLAHDKVTVTSHEARNRVVLETNRYLQVKRHYMPLYHLARTVRYLADPQVWVPFAEIEPNVLRRYLYPLEQSVQKLIGEDLKLEVLTLRGS